MVPKGPDEGNAEVLGAVAWESSSHRLAAMPAPFHKGAYWCATSASLVKGRWHGEAVTEGFRSPVPKPSPSQGEGGPQGRMRVGIVGCGGYRTGGHGGPPLRRVTMALVGADLCVGPSLADAPPWSPSSVMACGHATFSPAGRRLSPVLTGMLKCRYPSPHPSRASPAPPSPGGRLISPPLWKTVWKVVKHSFYPPDQFFTLLSRQSVDIWGAMRYSDCIQDERP